MKQWFRPHLRFDVYLLGVIVDCYKHKMVKAPMDLHIGVGASSGFRPQLFRQGSLRSYGTGTVCISAVLATNPGGSPLLPTTVLAVAAADAVVLTEVSSGATGQLQSTVRWLEPLQQ